MSERGGNGGWTPARSAAGDRSPWLIVGVISIATFMLVLDTSIANVALNHIAGGLSASYDEATWVITSFLIANAIIIPISGWLADTLGRKRYYMLSVALFTGASVLCGLSGNLTTLIMARILQGIGGGGLAPSEQSMLADTFPPQQRGLAFAAYGVVVIVGPILGPVLGGVITDNLSWHWIFLINLPVGILSLILVGLFVDEPKALRDERAERLRRGLSVDIVGIALVAVGLGCLEFTLDRGQRDDWFQSPQITAFAVIAALCIVALILWELTRKEPVVDLRLLAKRNLAISCVFLLLVGMIIFGTTQFIPQLLQQVMGYTATDAGLALTLGGVATIVAMPIAGVLSSRVDLRLLIGVAFVVQGLALWHMSHLSTDMAFIDAALARMYQAVAIPLLFIPISAAAYVGVDPRETNQASALMNVSRNLGGSLGISLVQALLAQRGQFHQARLVENLNELNPAFENALTHFRSITGLPQAAAMGAIYQQVLRQAAMLSYIEAFRVMAWVIFVLSPLVLFMRRDIGGGRGGAAA